MSALSAFSGEIDDADFVWQCGGRTFTDEIVNRREECGQRFSGPGRCRDMPACRIASHPRYAGVGSPSVWLNHSKRGENQS